MKSLVKSYHDPGRSWKQAWFLTLSLVFPQFMAFAVPLPPQNLTGELVVTGAAKVNGNTATTGMTILDGNRIEIGKDGLAAVNLDKLGRVTVHAETDYVINFAARFIGGRLSIGTIVVNIPCGVDVNIKTPRGEVTVPFDQTPATLTVEVSQEGTRSSIIREANAPPCTPADLGGPRSFSPFNPPPAAPPALGAWALPLFLVGGGGVGTALALALNDSIFPVAAAVTPLVP